MAIETGKYVENSIWFYAPVKPAPIIFLILFLLSFTLHLYQTIHYKSWKFTGLFPWAALVFVAGYSMRTVGAFHYDNVDVFIAATCLVYAAPPVYELANYITLGRCLYYIPQHSPLHPGRVITTFGGISAIVEILTANGASYSSNRKNSASSRAAGRAMLKAALLIQIGVIIAFATLAGYFWLRIKSNGLLVKGIKNVLVTLGVSMTLIMVRTIYRTLEYFDIEDINWSDIKDPNTLSPMIRYEWFFWLFEGTTMLLNTYLLNLRHPAMYLPRKNTVYLAEDGVTEIDGPGYKDDRKFIMTLADPFDLVGLFQKKDRRNRYWEKKETSGATELKAGKGEGAATKSETVGEQRV